MVGAGDFFDYLERHPSHPDRVVVLTNNWYHLGWPGTMSEDTVRDELAASPPSPPATTWPSTTYCLDDGWDGGWAPATEACGPASTRPLPGGAAGAAGGGRHRSIGLWVGPFGGYGDRQQARVAWAGSGAVRSTNGLLCVAGDAYRHALAGDAHPWTAAGVRYWKLDGVRFTCAETGHGHPRDGGRTVQMDRFRHS